MHWYSESEVPDQHKLLAEAKDLTFIIKRNDEDLKLGWSPYNQERGQTVPLMNITHSILWLSDVNILLPSWPTICDTYS